jgi:hypothetical protein
MAKILGISKQVLEKAESLGGQLARQFNNH